MKTSKLTFGTDFNLHSQQKNLLNEQPIHFIEGAILAENKLSKNGIKDHLDLELKNTSKGDILILSYISTKNESPFYFIVQNIKDLPKNKKKVEKFILESLKTFQPKETRVRTVHLMTSKKYDNEVLKKAAQEGKYSYIYKPKFFENLVSFKLLKPKTPSN